MDRPGSSQEPAHHRGRHVHGHARPQRARHIDRLVLLQVGDLTRGLTHAEGLLYSFSRRRVLETQGRVTLPERYQVNQRNFRWIARQS